MGNQSEVGGIAYNAKTTFNDIFYSEIGVQVFYHVGSTQNGELLNNGVYLRATQGVDVEVYKGPSLSIRAFGEQHSRVSIFKADIDSRTYIYENNSRLNKSYQIDAQMGFSFDYRGEGLRSRTFFMTQGFIDQINSSNGDRIRPVFSQFTIDQELLYSINPSIDLKTGVGVSIYDLGTGIYGTYRSSLGLDLDHALQGRKLILIFKVD